jgi:hypothetical protein
MPVARRIGGGVAAAVIRTAELAGLYNRSNRDFVLPEPVVHSPPGPIVRVYHGGRRLNEWEYEVGESIPGSGILDLVRLQQWAPGAHNRLVADYTAA